MGFDLAQVQGAIRQHGGDGWLFCDIARRDGIAYRVLGLDMSRMTTRRWYYFVPAQGAPKKLVHGIERNRLDGLPGEATLYVGWKELHERLQTMLAGCRRLFMQYSPENNLPLVSVVDAGTVELLRRFGKEVISSANLVQLFEAAIDEEGIRSHKSAGAKVQRIKDAAFRLAIDSVKAGKQLTEWDVQQFIVEEFGKEKLTSDGLPPIVAVNAHAADPHFEPKPAGSAPIREGDRLLIDLWARENVHEGIYYDITWCGFMGKRPDEEYRRLFDVVVQARNLTKEFIAQRMAQRKPVFGWEADDVCRGFIASQGLAEYFIHRTGHSIHKTVHGNGVNLDNLETRDDRELIPGTCFSIEPGIYRGEIGVRSEIDVLVDHQRNVVVVGAEQQGLVVIE